MLIVRVNLIRWGDSNIKNSPLFLLDQDVNLTLK